MENNAVLFESIFSRNLQDTSTQSYLEDIAAEHPYFSPAQFYLLLQTKKHDPAYKKQVQKTAALFNNNYWLNYLLVTSSTPEQIFIPASAETRETIADINHAVPKENNDEEEVILQGKTATATDITVDNDFALNKPIDEKRIDNAESIVEIDDDQQPEQEQSSLEETSLASNEAPVNQQLIQDGKSDETNQVGKTVTENNLEEKISNQSPAKNTISVADHNDALLFTPLHTSDYFASVGIKLSEEANSSDRLGKQLKSFTQWLKTMKKIDPEQAETVIPGDIAADNISGTIQTLAEKSNKEDEVITEAMADVLVQQGRITKAVEVLKKLSLLNPSKSTYFAAKIDQLKD